MISSILILVILVGAAAGMYFIGKNREKPDVLDVEEVIDEDLPKWKMWFKRLGFAGFMFFFIKGLIWLAIAFFAGKSFF